jgi:hypothetical protein
MQSIKPGRRVRRHIRNRLIIIEADSGTSANSSDELPE